VATLRFAVADDDAGSRLDRALAARPEIGTRSLAERLLVDGAVTVDGAARQKSHRLEPGSIVVVALPQAAAGLAAEPVTVGIAYRDEHLVVVDKPSGMTMHPGAGAAAGTLAGQLVTLGATGGDDPDRPGIVHRLDRDTSGLLVVARSQAVFDALQEAIRHRDVERRYLALVKGRPRSRTGRIDAPLGRDRRDPTRRSLDTEEPREAITRFEVVETLHERALLDVRLETGRTHQIRVHLAAIDLPVSGDVTYGVKADLGLERQFLHAHRLRLAHPATGSDIDVESPLPDDLAAALERARAAK
jgi:23S rRNA pseudouridine1911/1915/1917 synthase